MQFAWFPVHAYVGEVAVIEVTETWSESLDFSKQFRVPVDNGNSATLSIPSWEH